MTNEEDHKQRMEALYDEFMNRGWVPQFDKHPSSAPLEMVLIEPRDHKYLKQAICNMSCLVPYAALTIVHSKVNAQTLHALIKPPGSCNQVRLLQILPENLTRDEYSNLLTSSEFWSYFHTPKVLLFQTDSGMRFNNVLRFMEYDYVGAPWGWPILGDASIVQGNGGFSLRSVPHMKRISTDHTFDIEYHQAEDVFFAKHLHASLDVHLPSQHEAGRFSVEHVATTQDPMAFHQVWKFQPPMFVEHLLTQGLDPIQPVSDIEVTRAWLDSDSGFVATIPKAREWFSLGIGPSGLLIEEGTRIPWFDDPHGLNQRYLLLEIKKNGETSYLRVPLDRNRLTQTVYV